MEVHNKATGIILKGTELQKCYEGDVVKGRRHGKGKYAYPNQFFQYEGDFVHGKKEGYGTLTMADGGTYEGEFKGDEIMGQGIRTWPDGSTHSGEFVLGERTGHGVHISAEGDKFEGTFFENSREGDGVIHYVNGDVLTVPFVTNKPNGKGVLVKANGDRFEGDYVDGKRTGDGTWTAVCGDTYTGKWANDIIHGEGTMFDSASGLSHSGVFVQGRPEKLPIKLGIIDREVQFSLPHPDDPEAPRIPQPFPLVVTAGDIIGGVKVTVEKEIPPPPTPEAGLDEAEAPATPPVKPPSPNPGKKGKKGKADPEPEVPAEPPEEHGPPAEYESGRLIVARLHVGEAPRNLDTGKLEIGEETPDGTLTGPMSLRSENGEVFFEKSLHIIKELEGGRYTLIFHDETPVPAWSTEEDFVRLPPCKLDLDILTRPPTPDPNKPPETPGEDEGKKKKKKGKK